VFATGAVRALVIAGIVVEEEIGLAERRDSH